MKFESFLAIRRSFSSGTSCLWLAKNTFLTTLTSRNLHKKCVTIPETTKIIRLNPTARAGFLSINVNRWFKYVMLHRLGRYIVCLSCTTVKWTVYIIQKKTHPHHGFSLHSSRFLSLFRLKAVRVWDDGKIHFNSSD